MVRQMGDRAGPGVGRTPPRAVVVGSGFGGLAAAVRLRARGYAVTVVEALDRPGGRARVLEQDGFRFDAGPTVITAPYLIHELFELLGRDSSEYFELVPVDPFYRILFPDGGRFDYVGDEERLLAQIAALSPGDVDNYRRLAVAAERIFEVGYTRLADRPFHRWTTMASVIPSMIRLRSYRTVYGLVASHIRDERLRQALTFEPLLVGGNPYGAPSIYLLIHWLERKWGVHFALGGTGAIVAGLVRLLEEAGVEVRLSSPVEEIEVRGGAVTGVRLAGGERVAAEVVVSNADPTWVYRHLLAPGVARRGRWQARRTRASMSLFVGYFGTDRPYEDLVHHTILLGPRHRPLLDDIFRRRVLADDFSLYLHAPARTDPGMAPPGRDAFYVLSPVPNNRSGIDWSAVGEAYFDRILGSLEERAMPGLRDSLVTRLSMTPHDFEHTLRSVDGAAFGPEPILRQSAWFRYHNRASEVGGLYFVGAGTHPGAGVPGVLNSAKVLDRLLPAVVGPRGVARPLPTPTA
jgi:phytoene desaturase